MLKCPLFPISRAHSSPSPERQLLSWIQHISFPRIIRTLYKHVQFSWITCIATVKPPVNHTMVCSQKSLSGWQFLTHFFTLLVNRLTTVFQWQPQDFICVIVFNPHSSSSSFKETVLNHLFFWLVSLLLWQQQHFFLPFLNFIYIIFQPHYGLKWVLWVGLGTQSKCMALFLSKNCFQTLNSQLPGRFWNTTRLWVGTVV